MKMIASAAILAALFNAPASQDRIVQAPGIVTGHIGGVEGRFRIDPGATAMPIISSDWAARAGLKGSMIGAIYLVGSEKVRNRTAVTEFDVDGVADKRRVGWTDRPYMRDADGVIGPGGLDAPVIRFVLRPALDGEHTVALPMTGQGGFSSRWAELFAEIVVNGQPLRVRFDPNNPRTLVTANAAVRIADAQSGAMTDERANAEIAFGIERPVRTMRLAKPLLVGPLSISELGVRVSDHGSAAAIREESQDPDEIIVTGRKKQDPDRDRLSIGADYLSRCSSITFNKPAKRIELTCA
jgi:hypothetical protein